MATGQQNVTNSGASGSVAVIERDGQPVAVGVHYSGVIIEFNDTSGDLVGRENQVLVTPLIIDQTVNG